MAKTFSEQLEAVKLDKRRETAESLLDEYMNEWCGSDDIDELIESRWAIVTQRDEDAWVNGIDTYQDIAAHELGCLTGTEGYDEWVEGVYDLETGEMVPYDCTVRIEIKTGDGVVATTSNDPEEKKDN